MAYLFSSEVLSQDVHFTQIQATPLLMNPAGTGVSDYDFRVVNNYRNQWRSIEAPFNTYSISADRKLFVGKRAVGLGACYVHDLSSANHFVADKTYLSASYAVFFHNHQFVAGIQPGIVFRSFDQDDLTFGSQFNTVDGSFDPSMPSFEQLQADKLHFFDLNAGLMWRALMSKYKLSAGFAVFHINRPVESFLENNEDERLSLRYNLHANILIPLTGRLDLIPMTLYSTTSGAHEFIGGSMLDYSFDDVSRSVRNLYASALLRVNPFNNFDAVMLGCGMRILKFDLFVSYDINVSTLRKATNFYGAFEISLIYQHLNKRSFKIAEPCYML